MDEPMVQVGRTRYIQDTIAYHLVWIPKYRRKILTGEVQAETQRLLTECCERHNLALLALETDVDHSHVCVSAPPRFSPSLIANLLKGDSSRGLRAKVPHLKQLCVKEHLWTQAMMWARLVAYQPKRSNATLWSARVRSARCACLAFIPPPELGGASRSNY